MNCLKQVVGSLFVVLISLICCGQSTPQKISTPAGSATITDLKGDVTVTASQTTTAIAAQKGQLLAPNTLIETQKGTALLILSDGSQILIKSNTRIILRLPDEAKGNFLEQLIGKIVAKITKRAGNEPPFKMGTPSAVITVRGTHFEVEVTRKQKTFVQVYEGLVQVEGLGGFSHPVMIQPGYTTQVGVNKFPEDPRRTLEAGDVESEGSFSRSRQRESEQRGTSSTPLPGTNGGEPE
jgi:hypothetical protein